MIKPNIIDKIAMVAGWLLFNERKKVAFYSFWVAMRFFKPYKKKNGLSVADSAQLAAWIYGVCMLETGNLESEYYHKYNNAVNMGQASQREQYGVEGGYSTLAEGEPIFCWFKYVFYSIWDFGNWCVMHENDLQNAMIEAESGGTQVIWHMVQFQKQNGYFTSNEGTYYAGVLGRAVTDEDVIRSGIRCGLLWYVFLWLLIAAVPAGSVALLASKEGKR